MNIEKGKGAAGGFFNDRESLDSIPSVRDAGLGVGTPRRMKLLMNEENLRKYQLAQQMQNRVSGNDDTTGVYIQTDDFPAFTQGHSASMNDVILGGIGANDAVASGRRSEGIQRYSQDTGSDNEQSRHDKNLSFASRMAKGNTRGSR